MRMIVIHLQSCKKERHKFLFELSGPVIKNATIKGFRECSRMLYTKKSVKLVSRNFKKKQKFFFLHFWKKISMKEKNFQFTITTTIIFFCILSIHYRDEKPPINSKKAYVKKIEDWIITYVKIFLNKISIHYLPKNI